MTATALCHRNPNRAFSDPDNAPDFSIRAALKLCAACPVRTQCARDALLAHLPEEPELWQLQMIGAACLGHREPLAVVVEVEVEET